jgi:uncharacterized protein YdaU (DUF1376 family)
MNFYKRYPGDYGRDTGHLSLAEHGAYTLLLDRYYSTGSLPSDLAQVYVLCRAMTAADRRAVANVMKEFFPDGKNHRADFEIEAWKKQAEHNRGNGHFGALGGRPKKPKVGSEENPQRVTEETQGGGQTKPLSRNQIPEPEEEKDSRRGEAPPVGTLKTQIYRLAKQLDIAPGVITNEITAHSETAVWQALGSTLTAQPAEKLPYFRGCLKDNAAARFKSA